MARRTTWLCLVCLAGAVPGVAADLPDLPVPALDAPHDLVMAASCIERGQETAAATYLGRFLDVHPERVHVRGYLAELLWRRGRFTEARSEFERFLRDAQLGGVELPRQVHGHTRLMAIAERSSDSHREHLHRGIGLYLLGRQSLARDAKAAESLFCKAAGELTLARSTDPDAARPHWYLHLVWSQMAQVQAARRSLFAAAERSLGGDLTPAERRDLAVTLATDGALR